MRRTAVDQRERRAWPRLARVLGIVALALLAAAPVADAFCLRSPQVFFNAAPLQAYLNAVDGGINVTTDQQDAQTLSPPVGSGPSWDLLLLLREATQAQALGLYNAASASDPPQLFPVFPATALPGSYALCHINASGSLIVFLFDPNNVFLGQNTYTGFDVSHFGFYAESGTTRIYQQDSRNGNRPQLLTFLGTGSEYGDLLICFEDAPYSPSATFISALIDLTQPSEAPSWQVPCLPTPARASSWGRLKSIYR